MIDQLKLVEKILKTMIVTGYIRNTFRRLIAKFIIYYI